MLTTYCRVTTRPRPVNRMRVSHLSGGKASLWKPDKIAALSLRVSYALARPTRSSQYLPGVVQPILSQTLSPHDTGCYWYPFHTPRLLINVLKGFIIVTLFVGMLMLFSGRAF